MSERERINWEKRWEEGDYRGRSEPSSLVAAWADRLPKGRALDLACGNGRNALYLAERGFDVDALDIAGAALRLTQDAARERGLAVNTIQVDLDEYLLPAQTYDLITTTFYMNRNLVPSLKEALKPGGFALHEQHYHRTGACERPPEEARGCASESGIMVLEQKTARKQGAPNRCYHRTIPTVSA